MSTFSLPPSSIFALPNSRHALVTLNPPELVDLTLNFRQFLSILYLDLLFQQDMELSNDRSARLGLARRGIS